MAHQLNLLSLHFIYHSLAQPIVKKLISHMWLRRIESYLSSSHSDLTLAALKLLLAMSKFAGSKEQKSLLEAFSWDAKMFNKLIFMQRHDKSLAGQNATDVLERPDIRTLCLQFILSFISSPSSYVKSTLLEQHREIALVLFKRIYALPYAVVKLVLELLWTELWQDKKVKRTLKVGLFNEATINLVCKFNFLIVSFANCYDSCLNCMNVMQRNTTTQSTFPPISYITFSWPSAHTVA
jgi:nucleolar pre-ribosomal-associated protein 1